MIRSALVIGAMAALTIVPAGAATAQTYRHTDAKGDVQAGNINASAPSPAPGATDPDVHAVRITHGPRTVSVRLTFGDLAMAPHTSYLFVMEFRTNEGVRRNLEVDAAHRAWRGDAIFNAQYRSAHCRGLAHRIDYGTNVVTVTVPRRCLSNPRWVKVGAGAIRTTGGTLKDSSTDFKDMMVFADDAQSTKVHDDLTWSPRIHHG